MVEIKRGKETTSFFGKIKEKSQKYTFIGASTLPDRTAFIGDDGELVKGEILSKKVLDKFAGFINDQNRIGGKYGSYRTISLFHNRVKQRDYTLEEAGYVVPGTAEVKELESFPGNYGLIVDVEVNEKYCPPTEYPDYDPEKIHYKISKGALGLSIEYNNDPTQERIVDVEGEKYRYILDSDDFRGFGFARPDLIGNPTAIRVKETDLALPVEDGTEQKNSEANKMAEEELKKPEAQPEVAEAVVEAPVVEETKEEEKKEEAGDESKVKELQSQLETLSTKFKEMKDSNDTATAKIKESIESAFSSINVQAPAKTKETKMNAKIKEIYDSVESNNWAKFNEETQAHLEVHTDKFKEMLSRSGTGFDFEKFQTLKVKCIGSKTVVVPTAKTKDVIDSTDMAEATYYQTNAMFADRYVAGINETFLKEDSLLSAIPKEQHLGGNDKYQWRIWTEFETVTGTSTLAVDPNTTSVTRSQRDFLKLETRICEYRDGVEVTDFTQHHSMAAIGDLLGVELQRAAEAVVESMNSDLFKGYTDTSAGWNGFIGLLGVADSATYTTMYGRTRSAANRLLDATTANTYDTTAEAITVSLVREGYEKVLAHGSGIGDIVIVMHPTQVRKLFDTEDAAIRNNILTMSGAPATFGFNRTVIPHLDGIPIIRDYRCESSAAAADMFAIVDFSSSKGVSLVVSKPLGARGLAKVGTSESAYVNFWGAVVYKSPRNVFVHDSLT